MNLEFGRTADGESVSLPLRFANRHGLITGATGTGKCWGKDTPILMFDGSTRFVQDVKAGDLIMGPDSTSREVLNTTRGTGPLFRIVPVKGEPWVCNDVHILSLRCTATVKGHPKHEIINVPLNEWQGWSKTKKHLFKLWRTGVEFEAKECAADPYMLGLFMADGSASNATLNHNANDAQMIDHVRDFFGADGVAVAVRQGSAALRFSRHHSLWKAAKTAMADGAERFVPRWIKHNSSDVRRKFLAGYVDGDGYLTTNTYEISTKHGRVAEDLKFIARSLGLAATSVLSRKGIKSTGFEADYHRISISGDLTQLPVVLDRKRANARTQKKNVLNTGFSVESLGDGEYFGFELSGDRLCLLGDFTVTHNTVTLQRLAEQFSAAGVPVFAADVKGDLSGIATAAPVTFWDVFGAKGHPIRTSVQDMGPVLLARMLNLNETQAGTLAIALKRAEDQADYLLTLDDLRWQLQDMQDDREAVCQVYGNITASSIATIQRNLLTLEQQGGASLFGEPPFQIGDFMRVIEGKGMVNLLHADGLMEAPKLYGALIYWLLTELFRKLPEVGDLEKPKLVFFFDEAHLLFKDAPKHLLESIERIVRLVRSRGVGVYFVTQSPSDVPDNVLAQLGNRIQHALRAYTPKEQRFLKAAARAFRPNKGIDVETAVLEMGLGEALVSTLIDDGVPMPVERVKVGMPAGQIGPLSDLERSTIIEQSTLRVTYPAMVEGQRHVWEFQNRQRLARGLEALPIPVATSVDSMSMEQVLAPLVQMQQRSTRSRLGRFMWGMGWLAIAGTIVLAVSPLR